MVIDNNDSISRIFVLVLPFGAGKPRLLMIIMWYTYNELGK